MHNKKFMKKSYFLTNTKNSSLFARRNNPDLIANNQYNQADNQSIRWEYNRAGSQYIRYGYVHQADMIKLIISIVDMDVIIRMMISMMNIGVVKWILKSVGSIDTSVIIKSIIFMVMVDT